MNVSSFKKLFESDFYAPSYKRWRLDKEMAGKDITGYEYETFRKNYYKSFGFTIGNGNRIFGTSYNCDAVIEDENGDIIILEEAKASYLDSCFLGRAIQNAAEVFDMCLQKGINIPYFVISSSTKYKKYDEICRKRIRLYKEDLQEVFITKFKYFPLSENDRISRKKYFMAEQSCFNLSFKLIKEQNAFVKGLL